MTTEEKAKAYDEALERAKKLLLGNEHSNTIRSYFEHIFPELTESEDERIIRNLIDAFTEYKKSGGVDFHGIYINTLLSWLEKQKELFESGRGLYYYDGEKTTYCGYPATEDNPYDFAMSQQEDQKEPHYTKRNALFDKCVESCDPEVMEEVSNKVDEMLGKEQKPSCWNSPVLTHEMIMNEQKPAEWSEEDEEVMEDLYNFVISNFIQDHIHEARWKPWKTTLERNRQNRLKSLRPQPSWKPSEEDLLMLEHIIEQYETGNKNSKVMGYLPRVEELDFLKKVFAKWKN